ncbi:hypothetical protein G6F35_003009 [Rhizopus arrhizus]|nr:hypothetical protein G6F35_003009 [Rhizopus arrhizus]
MLNLGQASCLVPGYKPNDPEEKKKAKEHLEKSGLIAVHIRNHDPFQPLAIGINVHYFQKLKSHFYTKRHKWDGVVSILGGKASVMLIEFAGGFVNVVRNKLKNNTIKIYRNAARLLNSKNSSPENPPSIFVVVSHHFKIYFETLTLVTDRAYVRTRTTTIDVPFSPNGLKTAMEQLPTVFAWRDMVIASVKNTITFSSSNLETIPVPSTP